MNFEFGFILKKIVSTALMPLSLGFLLVVIALWHLSKDNQQKAKRYLWAATIWIVLITYAPFSYLLLKPLEQSYPKLEAIPNGVETILLLGGERKNRAWEALVLYRKMYRKNLNAKIITTGYSPNGSIPEAERAASLLIASGVNKEDIVVLGKPKDTGEEAQYVKLIVEDKRFILVTSAYHMPRAMKLFQSNGLKPIAAPTGFTDKYEINYYRALQGDALIMTENAWHEYIGLLWIKLKSLLDGSQQPAQIEQAQ